MVVLEYPGCITTFLRIIYVFFIACFQRYYWHKRSSEIYNEEYPFPVTVTFLVHDTIAALRPKLKLYESLEEAIQGVEDLIRELKPKIGQFI